MPSGDELEAIGQEMFDGMGLLCCGRLADVRLAELNPDGAYSKNEHLEVDYLLPVDGVCLVGEITDRAANKCEEKLRAFRKHLNAIDHSLKSRKTQPARDALWKLLGVRDEHLPQFRKVRSLKGFAILTKIEQAEIPIQQEVANCLFLYRYHWDLLNEYSETIGRWAQHHFLELFSVRREQPLAKNTLTFSAEDGNLLAASDRYVTADRAQRSHVVTFLANPYDLLPAATVCRRDALPALGTDGNRRYQRTLKRDKLGDIRANLLNSQGFIFPNGVLAVLSKDCAFDAADGVLTIPQQYGSLNIVDGQHRLFSYADSDVHSRLHDDARILVTAVVFEGVDKGYIDRLSARTFIEINTNQTRVSSLLLYGIGYEVLQDPRPKNLAAHILRKLNDRDNKVRGLLRTSDSPQGRIQSMEIIGSLGVITNVRKMASFETAKGAHATRRRAAIRELFGQPASMLSDPGQLTQSGIVCLERYFNMVAKIFKPDWPVPGRPDKGSAFELTKFHAGLIRLLRFFIDDGANWERVERSFTSIRDNVMKLRKRKAYKKPLFETAPQIPDATARISDFFAFLKANIRKPTSIRIIMKAARR